jgi:NTE family protein
MTGRWGLVLGGGGVLGAAWMAGALTALERTHQVDARQADIILGTSAGSVMTALLGAGVSVAQICAQQLGLPVTSGPFADLAWETEAAGAPHPPRPRLRPGNAGLVRQHAGRLHRVPPTTLLAGLAPEGRGSLAAVGELVAAVSGEDWSPHPGVRVVALDYETGRRVAFGAQDAPPAAIADAVRASCAIPGWYSPVVIGGRRYVDGGAWSATNVDLLLGERLDRVFVLAPMVSFALDHPAHWTTWLERRWRARVTRRCLREVAAVHETGTELTVIGPGPADLEVFGGNLMDSGRREVVLRTSIETSMRALAAPRPLQDGGSGRQEIG